MKISDPLGKVYTHTMFKKKSYELRDGDSDGVDDEDDLEAIHTISAEHHRSMASSIEDDEGESDDIDDSLSTKSSRIIRQHHSSSRRNIRDSSKARTVVSNQRFSFLQKRKGQLFFKGCDFLNFALFGFLRRNYFEKFRERNFCLSFILVL